MWLDLCRRPSDHTWEPSQQTLHLRTVLVAHGATQAAHPLLHGECPVALPSSTSCCLKSRGALIIQRFAASASSSGSLLVPTAPPAHSEKAARHSLVLRMQCASPVCISAHDHLRHAFHRMYKRSYCCDWGPNLAFNSMFLQLDPALSLNDDGHGTRTSLRVTICGLQLFRLSGEVIFAHTPTRYIHTSA